MGLGVMNGDREWDGRQEWSDVEKNQLPAEEYELQDGEGDEVELDRRRASNRSSGEYHRDIHHRHVSFRDSLEAQDRRSADGRSNGGERTSQDWAREVDAMLGAEDGHGRVGGMEYAEPEGTFVDGRLRDLRNLLMGVRIHTT